MDNIRNFCIIAHIDHGKSTLADCFLEITNTIINKRKKKKQLLDDMEIERERGITIKSHLVQMNYLFKGVSYILNLIDTPGHVDFSYEVSRSISVCDGALLLIDASQGIQSQTISNYFLALENNLTIIPVLNKIDILNIKYESVIDDIVSLTNCDKKDIIKVSAKKSIGINNILDSIISHIPPPKGAINKSLEALIFDLSYNSFRGVEAYFKVLNGTIYKGQKLKILSTGKIYFADEIGILSLGKYPKKKINTGNVGYIILGIKNITDINVGDIITSFENPVLNPTIQKFKKVKSMVFSGVYPTHSKYYQQLKSSISRLSLNDSSLVFSPETSSVLGSGFRCGFLGMFHMEIIQERLEREYNVNIITTIPNVSYRIFVKKKKNPIFINNPSELPNISIIDKIEEPYVKAVVITINDYIGSIISLCMRKRGEIKNQRYFINNKVELTFNLPLSEIVFNFYNKLKTISKGYSSFDYSFLEYRKSNLVKVDLAINHQIVDALSILVHKDLSFYRGKKICKKIKTLIPKHQFEIPIQACIGNKVIARETIGAFRKDVTSKCYGGDISRKRKLLDKQKKGKKRMREIGKTRIPQSVFMSIIDSK